MAATSRRARNYKEKSSVFTFGHFALPIAAVIALVLLFVGVKLFFLTPPKRIGVEVTRAPEASQAQSGATAAADAPDFELAPPLRAAEGIELSGQERPETTNISIVLASPLTQTGAAAKATSGKTAAQGSNAATRSQPQRAAPAAKTAPSAQPGKPSASAKWGVQVGAFVNESSASTLMSEVSKQGYQATVSKVDSSGKTLHRVRIGAGDTRNAAETLAAELKQKGYPVSVVPIL
ncbi:MAG: SPOR domain-containing protein [Synergistaceae bacterium]|jgi:DedD protein|nr:SPOR domain-containing protein [Synergistaceae bacterium]